MLGTKAKAMRTSQIGPLWRIASTRMPTKWGMFNAIGYERDGSNGTRRVDTALAMVMGDPTEGVPLLLIVMSKRPDGTIDTVSSQRSVYNG